MQSRVDSTITERAVSLGTLYLVPVPLAEADLAQVLPAQAAMIAARLTHFAVENAKTARHWLKWLNHPAELRQLIITELSGKESVTELSALVAPLLKGHDMGVMSEAGCPGVADPGANLVRHAHQLGIKVVPLVGPSSLLLALMASGLNGQRFKFHGYLPVDRVQRAKVIVDLETSSRQGKETQIFIETPYRNAPMFKALLETCKGDTLLCIAADVTGNAEMIATRTISAWRSNQPHLDKRPTVFLLLAI